VGQAATFKRSFTQKDFDRFAALSGDDNPIHVDPEFSSRTRFGRTVAHGMMLYAGIGRLIGTQLPGPGSLQIEQDLVFRHPTYTGTDITFHLEVLSVEPNRRKAELRTLVHLPDGRLACEGQTVTRLPGWTGGFDGPREPIAGTGPSEATNLGRLAVGQTASTRRNFTEDDLAQYADLTGDTNPLYMDKKYARRAGFPDRLVPGPLISGLFSRLLGTELPGRGTNWLKQRLVYPAAAQAGEEVTATIEIIRLRPEKFLANLRGTCTNAAGEAVCQGESLVWVKDVEGMPKG
jgi:acyl dehydratase